MSHPAPIPILTNSPYLPTGDETAQAKATLRLLGAITKKDEILHVTLKAEGHSEAISLPEPVFFLVKEILTQMALGNAISLIPINAELTSQQAADFLGVSRPYLVNLLDGGAIPFHKVGTHRRVRFEDLMRFKETEKQKRLEVLADLTREAQEQDMGY